MAKNQKNNCVQNKRCILIIIVTKMHHTVMSRGVLVGILKGFKLTPLTPFLFCFVFVCLFFARLRRSLSLVWEMDTIVFRKEKGSEPPPPPPPRLLQADVRHWSCLYMKSLIPKGAKSTFVTSMKNAFLMRLWETQY